MALKETTQALGYQQITTLTSAVFLNVESTISGQGINKEPTAAMIQCTGQPVRYRLDGKFTLPTATVGMLLNPGDLLILDVCLQTVAFIQTAPTAVLNVTYLS